MINSLWMNIRQDFSLKNLFNFPPQIYLKKKKRKGKEKKKILTTRDAIISINVPFIEERLHFQEKALVKNVFPPRYFSSRVILRSRQPFVDLGLKFINL